MNRVLTTPMETMIYTEKNCITYYEVFQMVQVCASKIQAETCGQRKRIVLNLDHTYKILVAILATLKCGCSYVPTSKNISEMSLNEIANWCNTDIIVTDDFRETNLKQIVLKDSFASTTNLEGMCSLINKEKYYTYRADDEVYVLFTSGSTGKPKGCSVSYSNLLYIIDNMMEIGKFVPSDVMQFSTPYTFDVSTTEIYSFMYGVSIFICDLSVFDKFKMWPELSYKHQITHLATSPSVFKNILNCFSEEQLNRLFKYMKCVMLAGEVFHKEIFVSWEKNAWEFHLWNLYGPTEATVYATCFELVHESKIETSVPIGKCLKGCVYNIIDMHDGVGELVLGGAGISSGYINNQAENDLRFYCENGKRFYKTGDLVSEENGVLMYHGRNDDQVQINGIRVELGEIEARIKQIYYIRVHSVSP